MERERSLLVERYRGDHGGEAGEQRPRFVQMLFPCVPFVSLSFVVEPLPAVVGARMRRRSRAIQLLSNRSNKSRIAPETRLEYNRWQTAVDRRSNSYGRSASFSAPVIHCSKWLEACCVTKEHTDKNPPWSCLGVAQVAHYE